MALFIPAWFILSIPLRCGFDKTSALYDPQDRPHNVPEDQLILCQHCRTLITTASAAIEITGQHLFRLTNPAEVSYEVVLYREAYCLAQGPTSLEHTWFAGFAWQIALCSHCATHLGWRYTSAEGHGFYGLIKAQLLFGNSSKIK